MVEDWGEGEAGTGDNLAALPEWLGDLGTHSQAMLTWHSPHTQSFPYKALRLTLLNTPSSPRNLRHRPGNLTRTQRSLGKSPDSGNLTLKSKLPKGMRCFDLCLSLAYPTLNT